MKRTVFVVLVSIAALSLGGCGTMFEIYYICNVHSEVCGGRSSE